MDPLKAAFDNRLQEIDAYLGLLEALERQIQTGPPIIGGAPITAQQQKILYSAVYLHLYNLVEATITWCIDAVAEAAARDGRWQVRDLSAELRKEWVKAKARTHDDLNQEKRLRSALDLCAHIVESRPVISWDMTRRNNGNWDDHEIESAIERLGCALRLSPPVREGIKRPVRDDKRPLELVKDLRNRLAHGSLSFEECGTGVTVRELKDIKELTVAYLKEVLTAFRTYIDSYEFLIPASRPVGGS